MIRKQLGVMLALGGALLLSGCGNFVKSEKPLFFKRDEVGAPAFRQGVWLSDKPDCVFDETRPMKDWPECADPLTLGKLGLTDPELLKGEGGVLAAGSPLILQMGDKGEFGYIAVEPMTADEQDRVTAFKAWPVLCGPPPKAVVGEEARKVTRDPLPGLRISGDDCLATRASVVRRAAAASARWNEQLLSAHWVREAAE